MNTLERPRVAIADRVHQTSASTGVSLGPNSYLISPGRLREQPSLIITVRSEIFTQLYPLEQIRFYFFRFVFNNTINTHRTNIGTT